MSTATHVFRINFARRVPDPNFHKTHGIERHYLTVAVKDMPKNISLDPMRVARNQTAESTET